jgi:hypothetical protein
METSRVNVMLSKANPAEDALIIDSNNLEMPGTPAKCIVVLIVIAYGLLSLTG